jgi:hypothetical protein
MMAELIMKHTVLVPLASHRFGHVLRMSVMCFFAASLLMVFQIVQAATPAPAATPSAAKAAENNNKAPEKSNADKDLQAYTAKGNMTVEALVKEVYLGTPLNNQVLVKALFEANPKVLNGKPTQSIKRNQVIYLPDHTALVVQILTTFTPMPTAAASDAEQHASQSSDQLSRRLWVRFP